MSHLLSDFRHSLRLLAGAPGFSTAAVLIFGVAPRGVAGTMTVAAPQWWFPLGSYDSVMNEMFRP